MPGLVHNENGAAKGSPLKKNRLSLKFFHKKETKRALDFSETQEEEQTAPEPVVAESCDQVVPAPPPTSPLLYEKRESLVPFVGLNNLGNTCYLNSILQVLYYCPGFKTGIKNLYNLILKKKDKQKDDEVKKVERENVQEDLPVNIELLVSFHSLVVSLDQLQSSYLLNPEKHTDGDLATPPRRLLNTLRLLNPMYEGYLQHDAQEVLQCILSYIQEACETLKKEHKSQVEKPGDGGEEDSQQGIRGECSAPPASSAEEEGLEKDDEKQANGKRKSDTEAGNLKKKPKPLRTQKPVEEKKHFTRSKRKSSSDSGIETEKEGIDNGNDPDGKNENDIARGAKKKKHHKLGWLKSSNKQPSIFSKFRSVGKLSTHSGHKGQEKVAEELKNPVDSVKVENGENEENCASNKQVNKTMEEKEKSSSAAQCCFDLMERLFQGQLVLRTRCLECECYTERREDFQDISVPVQEDEPCRVEDSSEISPEPKMELKTLKWAISQFASVERIVGEDKYFCETCHHYTEAERSLLFDKTPEVVTIHLKCFAANSSEFDPYAGPSKVNTPLQTPLKLSLEEWCTKPSKEHYELFAVVMHNGVTISSGHYTTYVKMMDLGSVEIQRTDLKEESGVDSLKPEPLDEETARSCDPQDYDDGEVSFSVSGKSHSTAQKVNVKKSSEGVGLLGGQRSISNFDLASSKAVNPEKTVGALTDNGKCERSSANDHSDSLSTNGKECAFANGNGSNECKAPSSQAPDPVLCNLLDYEGKWMLFDDCEVRLVEETEFLSSCSPASCSTSTPYLLFYKKVV
ncbi:ubiquitin carboxyl-terminal hydrolase 1-like [Acipenser ruthenus]|uniref:ubiquitin carboxyl-terminal hydrolase 1-like n=1 Tax=Acipenser ruthenus TaxID=7906 RepID=UPI00145BCC7F|nr:ubiquitin carboxyl-terminal hydrolase 1-like [Acipenser ruthenus]XP_033883788.3 ubiquitin carboxyl-terminal hydrolase 1-like [Acipenser ruthenus]